MVKTASSMLDLETLAPKFSLTDVITKKTIHLDTPEVYPATVIMFICNHCPYVKYILKDLLNLARLYDKKSVRFIAINSNDISQYPDDAPEHMAQLAAQEKFPFPYLFDDTQEVAKAYHAACTPDFFVFDKELKLAYRGQFDDARPGNNIAITGESIKAALDALIENKPVTILQKPSLGCSIKWKL